MIKTRNEICEVERIEAIECDRCKRLVRTADEGWTDEYQVFLTIRHQCGWGSRLGDGLLVEADLCQDCWIEMLKPFARIHE
ncbi:MAG: hypothetical protein IT368_01115 [Candidatus Hydrogenedentes bacterium]|nr:hypothetical protein [Candidatus Hydrogenedentota bacterium]